MPAPASSRRPTTSAGKKKPRMTSSRRTCAGQAASLRSRLPDLVYQEIWAYLIVHYAISVLIARAAEAAGLDPDRISYTRVLRIVRRTATGTADFPP